MKIAIKKETNAIDKFERRNLSKKNGTNSFVHPPNKIIGIVPITIDRKKLVCIRYSKNFFECAFLKLKISFLK